MYFGVFSEFETEFRGVKTNLESHQRVKSKRFAIKMKRILTDFEIFFKAAEMPSIPVMLVGNKCDESAELRELSTAEGQVKRIKTHFARCSYMMTSLIYDVIYFCLTDDFSSQVVN